MGWDCVVLIGSSVLLEVGGLGLVAVQLTRLQRREFGTFEWIERLRRRWIRLTGRAASDSLSLSGLVHARGQGNVTVTVRRDGGETVEARLTALERNLTALDSEVRERFDRQATEQQELANTITGVKTELQRQQAERDQERREQLRESMTLQWWGTGLFLLGAILAGLANAVC